MKPVIHITGARIATFEGADILDGTDLWIADGRILALLPGGSPAPVAGPVETLSLRKALVLPGAVNAHSHSASTLLRGTIPGTPLDLFVMEAMSRRAPKPQRQVQVSILLQAAEMLKHGVTAVVDHFRHGAIPAVEAVAAAFAAYEEAGVRAAVAPMFEDRLYLDSLPLDQAQLPAAVYDRWHAMRLPSAEDYFAMMEEVVAEARGRDLIQVLLGIDGPQRCTARLLEMGGDFAARHGIGLHTHLLEAKTQALMAPADCGGSFVAYLNRFGLIGPKSSLAHFVWCTGRDIELAAERGVNIVHNPVSNLCLGSGIQPAGRILEAGANVALGTDGSSSNGISLFEQAKFAMLLSRISQPDSDRWIGARQAMGMATTNGAGVLGKVGSLGVIRPGALADIAIIDLDSPAYHPMGDIWNHLVMYETGAGVDTVIVGGEIVLRHGKCTRFDEAALMAEADELAAADHAANVPFLAATRAERAVFKPLIHEALLRDAPVDRFAHLA